MECLFGIKGLDIYDIVKNIEFLDSGSYADVYAQKNQAIKINKDWSCHLEHTVLREGLMMSLGYGPRFHGLVVHTDGSYRGIIMDRAFNTLSSENSLEVFENALLSTLDTLIKVHRNGLVHGDIKPSNILLMSNSSFLSDFGFCCCKHNKFNTFETASESELYTINFRAPELLDNADGPWSPMPSADIWALGVSVYTYFIKNLNEKLTKREIVERIAKMTSHCVSERRYKINMAFAAMDVPAYIIDILVLCLDPDPLKRPSAELLRSLITRECSLIETLVSPLRTNPKILANAICVRLNEIDLVKPRQQSLDTLKIVCTNIWKLININQIVTGGTIDECFGSLGTATRELFTVISTHFGPWSITKCAVFAATVSILLIRPSGTIKNVWLSKFLNTTISDIIISMEQCLTIAILRPHWSETLWASRA